MKRLALIGLLLWLTGCVASDRSLLAATTMPNGNTPRSSPTRSVEPGPPHTATLSATAPLAVTTPITMTPSPTLTVRSQPVATSTLPQCPPLPTPVETKTQAAVQHCEHGLMFWLQDRNEIWTLIASPLTDQFYWRVLPNAWSEGQPESDPTVQPPADRLQPVRGFGVAWRIGGGSYGPQRPDLGWAVEEETGFDTTLIYYPQGYYSPDCTYIPKSGIYELTDEQGVIYQFVGAGGLARIVTSNE
jgi:hypothetical protein